MTDAIAGQLATEFQSRVQPFAALLGVDAVDVLRDRIEARAPLLAAQLAQDDDDRLAAQTVVDVMCVLWPAGPPEERDPGWWRTPLGRACARSLGRRDSDAVSRSVAAAMLGVTTGTIDTLIHRGTLARHPDGGLTRASVLCRMVRLTGG